MAKVCTCLLFEEIAPQTNLYTTRDRNRRNFSVAPGDLARFFGVLLLSGYHRLPQKTDYWPNQPDLGVPIVSDAMSRNSFQAIKSVIYFADNQNLPCGNKVAKVEPLYASLNEQLVQYGVFDNLLSIDESMVPYYGRHSVKMYILGKPIRFGFKIWSLCGSNGYPYHLKIYQGKEKGRSQSPLGTRVVNSMVNIVERHSEVHRHDLYFDNFCTSHQLLKELAEKSVRATCTIQENRTGGAAKLMTSTKKMKKTERGTFEYRCDGDVFVCKWNDNSTVHVASNHRTHQPVRDAKCRSKGAQTITVKQPISSICTTLAWVGLIL